MNGQKQLQNDTRSIEIFYEWCDILLIFFVQRLN